MGGDHVLAGPTVVGVERHLFNEPHRDPVVNPKLGEVYSLVVVDSAHEHAVDFHPKRNATPGSVVTQTQGRVEPVHDF